MWARVSSVISGNNFRPGYLSLKNNFRKGIQKFSAASATDQTKVANNSSGGVQGLTSEEIEETRNIAGTLDEKVPEKEKELIENNKKLLEAINEIDDKYKRALAENENIRLRMRREVADAKQFGIQSFVKDLLDVADVLNKATEVVPMDAVSNENPHLKNLFEGLLMTEAQLQTVFRRHGVTKINPLGEKFNPNVHEALFEQEDPTKEPGTVGLVTKIGYKLNERTIRPALVGVVKTSKS